jgi:hypothetical protein
MAVVCPPPELTETMRIFMISPLVACCVVPGIALPRRVYSSIF